MESVTSPPILGLPTELQIDCFSALGEVDGTLIDAFNMAMTNKKLYAIYVEHGLAIDSHIVISSIQAFTDSSLTSDDSQDQIQYSRLRYLTILFVWSREENNIRSISRLLARIIA